MPDTLKSPKNLPQPGANGHADDLLLQRLREQWLAHQVKGLEVRHAMGVILNNHLGDPSERLPRGEGLVDKVATELAIDKTDISRFRRFAARFPDLASFREEHPEVQNWTAARELIAKPRRRVTGNRTVAGILRSLRTTTTSLRRVDAGAGPEVDQIRSALQELVLVAHSHLGIAFDEMEGMNNTDSPMAIASAEAA